MGSVFALVMYIALQGSTIGWGKRQGLRARNLHSREGRPGKVLAAEEGGPGRHLPKGRTMFREVYSVILNQVTSQVYV